MKHDKSRESVGQDGRLRSSLLSQGDDPGDPRLQRAGGGRQIRGEKASRSASPELQPRPPSGSPERTVRAGSAGAGLRGRYLRRGASELLHGLSDGDMYGMRPTELPYRATPKESGPTFGDYEFGIGHPPGLGGAGHDVYGEAAVAQPSAVNVQGPTLPAATAPEASTGTSAPSPLDVLITGMSQLQQLLLKQKGCETLDLEPKAVNELAKLPEYTAESGATDFQDYLYLAEQQIGSLASGAAEWWQKTLSVAQKAYSEYQSLSPMKRLSVKASLTEELKEDRCEKLERKVASLMLSSPAESEM